MNKSIDKKKSKPKTASFSTSPSQELKKVTWPNRNTLVKSTILILIIVTFITLYVFGLDLIFSSFISYLQGLNVG